MEILEVRWCDSHAPRSDGTQDAVVVAHVTPSGSAEAGGEANRRWCALLHGRVTLSGEPA